MELFMALIGFMVLSQLNGKPLILHILSYTPSCWRFTYGRPYRKIILFFTDNFALVSIINCQTSKNPHIMKLLRVLILACLQNNILFQARHSQGCKNVLADSLSRLQVEKFRHLSPNSRSQPEQIPQHLLPQNFFEDVTHLLNSALAPGTVATYKRAWKTFSDFGMSIYKRPIQPPVDVSAIGAFLAYLNRQGYAPKTMSTFLSAISYAHKLLDFPDPTSAFVVSKLITGASRMRPTFDILLPISVTILNRLLESPVHTTESMYYQCLYKVMFLFAFNTFARVGELTSSVNSAVQLQDIVFQGIKPHQSVTVTFRNLKHNLTGRPDTISFQAGPTAISAVTAMTNFLNVRGRQFCSVLQKPLPRCTFDSQLRRCLNFCDLDTSLYKGHSFRIGATTYRAE